VHVAFVDMGHASTELTIVAFKRGGLAVKAHAWDRDLGGRDLDDLIFGALADDFKVPGLGPRARRCLGQQRPGRACGDSVGHSPRPGRALDPCTRTLILHQPAEAVQDRRAHQRQGLLQAAPAVREAQEDAVSQPRGAHQRGVPHGRHRCARARDARAAGGVGGAGAGAAARVPSGWARGVGCAVQRRGGRGGRGPPRGAPGLGRSRRLLPRPGQPPAPTSEPAPHPAQTRTTPPPP
jgi:hypothetical protein